VELVLVVAIVGILAAIAAPRFAGAGERYKALVAADRVMRDVAHARARAIASGAVVSMDFTPATVSYTINGMRDPDAPAKSYVVDLTATPYRCTALAADFGGSTTLKFNGYGVPASGGSVTVTVGSYKCVVTVAAGTGVGTVGALSADTNGGPPLVVAMAP
jgi:type II secretory pathway pseudopilin PulG